MSKSTSSAISLDLPVGPSEGGLGTVNSWGREVVVSWSLGASLLVDGATYKEAGFIAPVNGVFIKEIWAASVVAITGSTSTLNFDNYDKSAAAAGALLATADYDPELLIALKGNQMVLTTTLADRWMDEGDVLNSVLVCGTMTADGEGHVATAVLVLPQGA